MNKQTTRKFTNRMGLTSICHSNRDMNKSGHQSTNDGCIEQLDEYVYQTYEICIDEDTMKKQSTNITYMRTGVQFAFLVGNSPQ